MTCENLAMGKGTVIKLLFRAIHPYKHIRKEYPNMERGQRLKNAVVLRSQMKKTPQREAVSIIFTHQDFRDGDDLIELYNIERWRLITTEGDRHLFFSDGPSEEHVEAAEVDEMVEKVVELVNFPVLGNHEVGLAMHIMPNDDDNDTVP